MLRKAAFLLLLLIFININLAHATTGYKYVDGFTSTYLEWTEYGSSPYLSAIDYPTNYIYLGLNKVAYKEGNWTFADATSTESTYTLTDVKFQLYSYGVEDPDVGNPTINAYVYDGSFWRVAPYAMDIYESWGWYQTASLFSHVSTWAEVNATVIYITGTTLGDMEILMGDCGRLILTYTTGGTSYTYYVTATLTTISAYSKRVVFRESKSASQTLNAEAAKRFLLSRPQNTLLSMTPEQYPRFTFYEWAGTSLSLIAESVQQFFRPINIYGSSALGFLIESSYTSSRLIRVLGLAQLELNVFSISNLPIPETNWMIIPILFVAMLTAFCLIGMYKKG